MWLFNSYKCCYIFRTWGCCTSSFWEIQTHMVCACFASTWELQSSLWILDFNTDWTLIRIKLTATDGQTDWFKSGPGASGALLWLFSVASIFVSGPKWTILATLCTHSSFNQNRGRIIWVGFVNDMKEEPDESCFSECGRNQLSHLPSCF